jgi:hypothetical protein
MMKKMNGPIQYLSNIKILKRTTTTTTIYIPHAIVIEAMIEIKDINPYHYDNNAREIRKRALYLKIIKISKFQSFKYYNFRNIAEFGKDRVKGRVHMIISYTLPCMVSEFKLNSETDYWYLYITIEGFSKVYIPDPIAYSLSRPKAGGRGPLTIKPRTERDIYGKQKQQQPEWSQE